MSDDLLGLETAADLVSPSVHTMEDARRFVAVFELNPYKPRSKATRRDEPCLAVNDESRRVAVNHLDFAVQRSFVKGFPARVKMLKASTFISNPIAGDPLGAKSVSITAGLIWSSPMSFGA